MALLIPDDAYNATIIKEVYVKKMAETGIILTHQKDIHHKKPFWSFWEMKDCSIAVFKIQFTHPNNLNNCTWGVIKKF